MFFVYTLRSERDGGLYIGFAPNLELRLEKHRNGLVRSTKYRMPLELIYYEAYKSKHDALIREKRLKNFAKGFASLKRRLEFSLMLQE